ncbi:hypothetical protein KR084_010615 [Drosophila pseudotakahashii]|nr:hypothetical protein KR084_010615 [Drosophila pseudotakahashii]
MSLLATPMPPAANASSSASSAAASASGIPPSATNNNLPFEKDKIWYFSNDQLVNSPSRRCGIKGDDELQYRQMTAYLIQEMGQRLQVSQLCINTAIVYMHRFYAFHSFTHFHRNSMASASLFLAAKVEEQPRKLEHVIRAANKCLPPTTEQNYAELAQELVFNENVLLQTLGFDVAIDHPHTHVVRTCQLVKACKDLAQTSYFLASNSLHLTSMCLQYRPTVVACFCIYLACKWSRWEIPQSTEGKHWFYYVDKSVSLDLLKQLTDEFIAIYEKSPARLKSKLNSIKAIAQGASNRTANSKDKPKEDWKITEMMKGYHSNITPPPELLNGNDNRERERDRERERERDQSSLLPPPAMVPQQRRQDGSHQRSSSVGGVPGSSSSSSSSNHKMPSYPSGMPEVHPDHKSKPSSYSNRLPSSHQRSSSSGLGSSGSSSQRSSSSSSSSSQQPGRPSMPVDYHKPSRGMPPVGVAMPPHGSHKMPSSSKSQPPQQQPPAPHPSASNSSASGMSSKDKSQSSKMYPNAPPPYSNSAPQNPLMSRGGYPGASNGSQPPPPAGYGGHRSKSGSTVHGMPPYEQQLPYTQSQGYAHMQQPVPQQPQQQHMPPEATQQHSSQSKNSLFSPEWPDIKKEPLAQTQPQPYNGLVRSLLKESLCPSNASLLKPDALTMPGLKPPAELLEPMPTMPVTIKKEPGVTPITSLAGGPAPMDLEVPTKLAGEIKEESSSKSEKKKKKDKHKHKEKDKSKDKTEKEERKKHKKDKQKDRSSSGGSKDSSLANEPLKMVIKNPNGNLQSGASAPIKLKISKNKVEPNNYSAAAGLPGATGYGLPPASATTSSSIGAAAPPALPPYGAGGGGYSSSGGSSSGGSSKKKHSDRDRDKESKKSKSQDYAKYNGAGGGVFNPLGGAGAVPNLIGGMGAPLATTAPPSMLLAPTSALPPSATGLAPPPMPVYNKK